MEANKMSVAEKSKISFSEVYGSEHYWSLRCRIKEELLKSKPPAASLSGHVFSIDEIISKTVKDLNIELELKNKVYEIYEGNLKEESPYTWAKYKMKDCKNVEVLPSFFLQPYEETLEPIVLAKATWNEFLKQRVENLQKTCEKPLIRRRPVPVEPEKKEVEQSKEEDEKSDEGEEEEIPEMAPRSVLFEATTLLNSIMKLRSDNYAADPALTWGSIKIMLQTRSLEELRAKFTELNVALRQIGVDDEKSFIEERYLIGDRLIQKNAVPLLTQFAKRGVPHALRPMVYKKILCADQGEKGGIYFEKLQSHYNRWETLLDDIVKQDWREFCNDDKYYKNDSALNNIIYVFVINNIIYYFIFELY